MSFEETERALQLQLFYKARQPQCSTKVTYTSKVKGDIYFKRHLQIIESAPFASLSMKY
jgi:hypothetical protein